MNNKFQPLESKDVLSLENFERIRINVVSQPMLKVEQFKSRAQEFIMGNWSDNRNEKWIVQGVPCEVLKPGGNWQKGKVRVNVTLEFCPDEPIQPPSPLDDIRKQLKETES